MGPEMNLEDTVLLVTGAAHGIGRAVAEEAVRAGVKQVFLTDLDDEGLGELKRRLASEAKIATRAADLSDPSEPERIVAEAKSAFGRVDALVNSAGLTTRGSFLDGTAELWDKLFALNARAPFLLMKEVISDMLARGSSGAIVNIQSMNAHCGAPDLAVYAATKGALQTLTKNAANAHVGDGIRVNGINLGWTLTESEDRMQSEILGEGPGWATRAGADLPLGRLLQPEEAARLAIYLLSPASAPMTGASIDLDQTIVGAPG